MQNFNYNELSIQIKLTSDFSFETQRGRKKQNEIFKVLNERNFQSEFFSWKESHSDLREE